MKNKHDILPPKEEIERFLSKFFEENNTIKTVTIQRLAYELYNEFFVMKKKNKVS